MNFLDKVTNLIPGGHKEEDSEYLLALIISSSDIYSALWTVQKHKLNIISHFSTTYSSHSELLEKGNFALDSALADFPAEPKRLLLGVPNSWTHDDNLKEEHLKILKNMVREYELEPVAYVTASHALNYYLQKKEGVAPTAIILGIGDEVEATVVRGGKIIDQRSTKRGDHLYLDIEKNLAEFTEVEVLPSKIVLYSTSQKEDLNKLKDNLMSNPWMQKLPFLHFPKIEILPPLTLLNSVIFAGAFEVDADLDIKHSLHFPESTPVESHQPHHNLGFISGDIHKSVEVEEDLPAGRQETAPMFKEETSVIHHHHPSLPILTPPIKLPGNISHALSQFFNQKRLPSLKLLALPIVLLLFFFMWLFLVKAEVNLLVDPKIIKNETQVIADPTLTAINESEKVIPATVKQVSVKGSGTQNASGQKQIGNSAKGKVLVYNLTSNKVDLNSGVKLSANNLQFSLDNDVAIASQSSTIAADFTTVIKPGKSDLVGTTAVVIGPEGNLPAGTDLTVAGYTKSQVVARVEEAFSGGTSKSVNVVTGDDQKKLQAKVTDELKQKAIEDLKGELEVDEKIIPEALSVLDGKYNFNKAVNDQASEFSLNADVRFKATSYKESDLKTIVAKLVSTDIPAGYQLNLQDSETTAEVVRVEKDGKLIFSAKFIAKMMPKYNSDEIKGQIRGQSLGETEAELKKLENVVGVEVRFTPKLPAFLSRIPLLSNNITVKVSPK